MDVGRQLQKITGGLERDFFLLGLGEPSEPQSDQQRARRTPAWMRGVSISLLAPLSGGGVQDEFLQAPFDDFGDQNFILHAAIDSVHRAELSLLFAGDTEFAEDVAVQLHLEDLAADLVQLGVLVSGLELEV